jgi:aminopeptidase N
MKNFLLFCLLPVCLLANAQKDYSNPVFDVLHYRFNLDLNDDNDIIKGEAIITVRFLHDAKNFDFELVKKNSTGKGMIVTNVKENNNAVLFSYDNDLIRISTVVYEGDTISYAISYKGIPADGLIIAKNKYGHRVFFGDNWPNRAHNWLPCIDHPSDKASVDFVVTAPEHYQVIANGVQVEENNLPNHQKLTHWKETADLPTKVMVMGAADFAVNYAGNADCIPVYSWVYPEDKNNGFYDYALAKEILPYFIRNVGAYPYGKLANVQSKTTYGGLENASAIFYFENSITGDRKSEPLLTHEIAHQWFGDAASETDWPHVWLSEGFATYMTHLYMENKYGVDILHTRMKEDRQAVIELSKKRMTPVVDSSVKDNFNDLLNANSYQKGGWVLHMLRRKLGDTIFWKGIQNYYAQYTGRNASTDDFRTIMEATSNEDLKPFFKQWLHTTGQPFLTSNWRYGKGGVTVTVKQTQPNLFEFPLEIMVQSEKDTSTATLIMKGKTGTINIPVGSKPINVILDPNIDLLFEEEKKGK